MKPRTPEQRRETNLRQRAARKAKQQKVYRLPDVKRFVAWDGEGVTDKTDSTGSMKRGEWNARVKIRAREIYDEREASQARYWDALRQYGGRITADVVLVDGIYRIAGEFADVPRHLLRKPRVPDLARKRIDGNADQIADAAGCSVDDLLAFFADNPRRNNYKTAVQTAESELSDALAVPSPHRYVMLASSRSDSLVGSNLATHDIFQLLLHRSSIDVGAVHVIFGGSYDITLWLRDLQREQIGYITRNETSRPVWIELRGRTYAIHYRPRKHFELARFRDASRKFKLVRGKWMPDYDARIKIWEVFGFFQQRFVDALRAFNVDCDLGMIERMKNERSQFTDADAPQMLEYCIAECKALESLMITLQSSLRGAALFPARWDGAGAVAAALLRREGVKAHIQPEPDHLIDPIARAFFGGRIESCQIGRARTTYSYDIASAYPAAACSLPSLRGQWIRQTKTSGFALYRLRWNFRGSNEPWFPLPYRHERDGTITFPDEGEGWYWAPEAFAAIEWMRARVALYARENGWGIDIVDSWTLVPDDSSARPFGFVPELFARRQEYKRQKNGAEKALKLGLNSLYGKTAQQVGATQETPPPYFSLAWAGWITSTTRARLISAATANPRAIIAFATDGIYSTAPLPIVCAKMLGSWEGPEVYDEGVFVAAGIYWLRRAGEEKWLARYRGFDREPMTTPDAILQAWKRREGAVSVPSTRFVTHRSALLSDDMWEWAGTWRTIGRALRIDGGCPKRAPQQRDLRCCARALLPLTPASNDGWEQQGCSAAFDTFRLGAIDGIAEDAYSIEQEEGTL